MSLCLVRIAERETAIYLGSTVVQAELVAGRLGALQEAAQ